LTLHATTNWFAASATVAALSQTLHIAADRNGEGLERKSQPLVGFRAGFVLL
jgi:hypothetical protein